MKLFIQIFILFIIISCKQKSETYSLSFINHVKKLEIRTEDSKCGEWGGDEKILTIYRDGFKGELLGDYIEKIKNCANNQTQILKSIKRIKINTQETELIYKSINELTTLKLSHEDLPSHSGIFNQILLSDSSLILRDFPSSRLKSFQTLIMKIKNK